MDLSEAKKFAAQEYGPESVITDAADVAAVFRRLQNGGEFGIDCETNGVDRINGHAVGLSVSNGDVASDGKMWGVYIPWGHINYPGPEQPQASLEQVRKLWQELVNHTEPTQWVFFNAVFDRLMLGRTLGAEVPFSSQAYDVMHMIQLLNPGANNGLKQTTVKYFGISREAWDAPLEEYRGDQENSGDERVPPNVEGPYAALDARNTLLVKRLAIEEIKSQGMQKALQLETMLLPVVMRLVTTPLQIDAQEIAPLADAMLANMDALAQEFRKLSGWDGDPSDDLALREYLFTERGYPVPGLNRKGEPNLAGYALAKIAKSVPGDSGAVRALANYRDALYEWKYKLNPLLNPEGARVDIRQIGPSGLLAAMCPDLGEFDSEFSQTIRKALLPAENKVFVVVDSPALDLCLIAQQGSATGLRDLCNQTDDLLEGTATKLGVSPILLNAILQGKRRGMGHGTIAKVNNLPLELVDASWKKMTSSLPEVSRYYYQMKQQAENGGDLRTSLGRRIAAGSDKSYLAPGQMLNARRADFYKSIAVAADNKAQKEGGGGLFLPLEDGLVFQLETSYVADFWAQLGRLQEHIKTREGVAPHFRLRVGVRNLHELENGLSFLDNQGITR